MSAFFYTALRDIMSGHTASTAYSFDASLSNLQRQPRVSKKEYRSMSGYTETVVERRETVYTATSIIEDGSSADQWLEFLSSVDGGEQFQVDINGTIASPQNVQNAVMQGGFRQNYLVGLDAYQFSFSFRIV